MNSISNLKNIAINKKSERVYDYISREFDLAFYVKSLEILYIKKIMKK